MINSQTNISRQCATLSTAIAKRLQDSVVYLDDGAAEAAVASFGTKLQQGLNPVLDMSDAPSSQFCFYAVMLAAN